MFKTLLITLAMTTACATSEKPTASAVRALSMQANSEAGNTVAFADSRDGTKIAFEAAGSGPALVIIGGALSHRSGAKPLASKLVEHFTVYTYDRRGHGESTDTKPYSVDSEIEDIGALIEQAGNQAYVYGVSSGAALALQAAVRLGPTKVSKLAVYEPPYGQDEHEFNQQKDRIGQLTESGMPGEAAAYFFSAIGTPPETLENMKRSPEWEGIRKVDFTLVYDYTVLGNGSVPEAVKLITIPTLVLDGEKSMPFIRPAADRIAEFVPGAQRKTIPGQTHQAAPDAVAPLLIEFFDKAN